MPTVEARLGELFDARCNSSDEPMSRDELVAAMRECDVLVPTVTDRIDAEMLAEAGDRLGLIANFGAGTDHIDLKAAAKRRILVTNTPGVFTEDTADLTMAGIIGVPRRVREGVELIRSGQWTGWTPTALHRKRLPEAVERMFGARYVETLDGLVREADILTLHCPASESTRGMIDARRIGLMKEGASLINTARGDLVDQEALIAALESGHMAGAGLDVYPDEPHVDERLIRHPNVMTLPHIGSATREGREESGHRVIANIRVWADGHRPPDQVLTGLS